MEYSEQFMLKIMKDLFGSVLKQNWIRSFIQFMIDSKYRTYKTLTSFLEDQIDYPHPVIVELANGFYKNYPDEDRRIIAIQNWVIQQIKYKDDRSNWGAVEKWANAIQTYYKRADDCDGGNALIYVLARLSGIQPTKLWCAIGDTPYGGHFWCVYYSTIHMKATPIDFCYYVDKRAMHMRKDYDKQLYNKIWYIFNDEICFKGD